MISCQTRVRFLSSIGLSKFQSAVSLHSHTHHSRENLGFLPSYASRIPILSQKLESDSLRYRSLYGKEFDWTLAYWTPPLSPRIVLDSEINQIEQQVGLRALVSVTDHDNIDAASELRTSDDE